MVFEIDHFATCPVDEFIPDVLLTGACDEPIPWELAEEDPLSVRRVRCCCEY